MIFIETISFSDALKFPFKTPKRLLYALWLIIPVIGWLILFGYIVRLVNEFIDGNYEGLIKLDIMDDLKLGAIIFLKSLPFLIAYLIVIFASTFINENLGFLVQLLVGIFIFPILMVNFLRKQTIESFFEFNALNVVRDNLGDYIIAILKQFAIAIIFGVLSFIVIGIPAYYFTYLIFIANFYGRLVEHRHTLALKTQSGEPLTT